MEKKVSIIGAGLAGSEAALQLAERGVDVVLFEARPQVTTPVHRTSQCAELVCSNSLKSTKPDSAAGMLKYELVRLGSHLYARAIECSVPAGGALAVDRTLFSEAVTRDIEASPHVTLVREEVRDVAGIAAESAAVIVASGPLTSEALAMSLGELCGTDYLAFYDAAAPIVLADSLDYDKLFYQSRYAGKRPNDDAGMEEQSNEQGDYLNAAFTKEEYDRFIDELVAAERVVSRDFETADLFQACQPIEEIARRGHDAPRFGPLKPVGLTDPRTGKRPWAVLQLRAEDAHKTSFNLVGFQTNLKFPEQKRVFSLIPGLEHAEFARYGVMHRNTFIDAPHLLDASLRLCTPAAEALDAPVFVAGQLSGTEGYCEAMRSGLHAALSVGAYLAGVDAVPLPAQTAFGALVSHATDPTTTDYQPMHVNFGIMEPLDPPIRNKSQRYHAYAERGKAAVEEYCAALAAAHLMGDA